MRKALICLILLLLIPAAEVFGAAGTLQKTIPCPRLPFPYMERGEIYWESFAGMYGTYNPLGEVTSVSIGYSIPSSREERPSRVYLNSGYSNTSVTVSVSPQLFQTQFAGQPISSFYGANPQKSFFVGFRYASGAEDLRVAPNSCTSTIYVSWEYTPPPEPDPEPVPVPDPVLDAKKRKVAAVNIIVDTLLLLKEEIAP